MVLIIFFFFNHYRGFVLLFTIFNRLKEVCVSRSEEKKFSCLCDEARHEKKNDGVSRRKTKKEKEKEKEKKPKMPMCGLRSPFQAHSWPRSGQKKPMFKFR
jgi:hypothetical protein